MCAEEHAGAHHAGEGAILRRNKLNIRRHDGDEHVVLRLKRFKPLAGEAVPAEFNLFVIRIGDRVKEVGLLRFFHNMNRIRRNRDADHLFTLHKIRGLDDPFISAAVHIHFIMYAHEDDGDRFSDNARAIGRNDIDILRTNDNVHLGVFAKSFIDAIIDHAVHAHLIVLQHDTRDDIALADKVRDEWILRLVVDIRRSADLLNDAVLKHDDGVAHGQRFLLIMGDIDKRNAEALLHVLQFNLHFLAELEVERAERFVEEEHLRFVDKRAGDGDALLLTAGELLDISPAVPLQVDELEHGLDLFFDGGFIRTVDLQTEGDVVKHIQVRKQSIFLEYGVDLSQIRRRICDIHAVHLDTPGIRHDKSRNQAEHGCFAAAGWAEQR
ncbi:hypothetical protein SDC9_92538 [bioreactor metagenome]|uniref:Uncharacterized protein n=1 Tax=bioreactor metagenome TaxID=1076179 RepID=A0A644ZYP8_9ZZZZ